jgi:hypothetical protein
MPFIVHTSFHHHQFQKVFPLTSTCSCERRRRIFSSVSKGFPILSKKSSVPKSEPNTRNLVFFVLLNPERNRDAAVGASAYTCDVYTMALRAWFYDVGVGASVSPLHPQLITPIQTNTLDAWMDVLLL